MTARTLPLRVMPVAGEAIDSWMEAIAYRYNTALADVIAAAGLPRSERPSWVLTIDDESIATLARITGVAATAIAETLMRRFEGTALRFDNQAQLKRSFPFGGRWRSRYCPYCLAESGGRWQLSWRLAWSFACTRHLCLLADRCPGCGKPQRRRVLSYTHTPQPGQCAVPGVKRGTMCGADLSQAAVRTLASADPVIAAQRLIRNLIADNTTTFGLYANNPAPAHAVLSDVKALAVQVLSHAVLHGPAAIQPAELASLYAEHDALRQVRWRYRRNGSHHAPESAADTAVAVTAAVTVLQATSIDDAAQRARWLVPRPETNSMAVGLGRCRQESPLVAAILIKAYQPHVGPHRQLRYRCALAVPKPPEPRQEPRVQLADRLPASLWPSWTARLAPPGNILQNLPPTLSSAVLLVGSTATSHEAAAATGGIITGFDIANTLVAVKRHPQWPAICAGITRVAEYVKSHRSPINYGRRRCLDYSGLLPSERWREICSLSPALSAIAENEVTARSCLAEMVSGSPVVDSGWYPTAHRAVYGKRAGDFLFGMTPDLMDHLRGEGRKFLTDNHIKEPLIWSPPVELLSGLALQRPNDVDFDELRGFVEGTNCTIGRIARLMNISVHAVRYLLEKQPINIDSRRSSRRLRPVLRTKKRDELLTAATLRDLYVDQGLGLTEIGDRFHMSQRTVSRLAQVHHVPIRRVRKPDRDWLYREFVIKRRRLPDIAAQLGCHPDTVGKYVHSFGLPRQRNSTDPSAIPMTTRDALRLLAPPIARRRWTALTQFATASAYPTLTVAAEHIGISVSTLCTNIGRLEAAYGERVFIRACQPLPMELTTSGAQLVQAVHIARDQLHGREMASRQ
jgi:hypothetical protein